MRGDEGRIRQPFPPLLPELDQIVPVRSETMQEHDELFRRPDFGERRGPSIMAMKRS